MLHLCFNLIALFAPVSEIAPTCASPWLRVEISMAGDGFMCPFLTPMFLEILEEEGKVDWVVCHHQQSEVEFSVPLEFAKSQKTYSQWLTGLGYQEAHITFLQFDTLLVQPAIPDFE
jgi:hypothetical protein